MPQLSIFQIGIIVILDSRGVLLEHNSGILNFKGNEIIICNR